MRSFRRVLSTSVTALAFTAAGLATAAPAAADPGEGCVGLPELPAAFVCVVELNPGALVPSVTTTPVPVRVPPVCYLAGCTAPTTVNVPVPNATPGSGNVAVLFYNGTYYPIGAGLDVVWALVEDIQLLADDVVREVDQTLNDLPDVFAILRALQEDVVDPIVAEQLAEIERLMRGIDRLVGQLPGAIETLLQRIDEILQGFVYLDPNLPVCTTYTGC